MYKDFYGLRANPFNVNPDPRYLFLTRHTEEALACLTYGIQSRKGFVLLTGEVGTGKTEHFPTSIVGIQAIAMMPAQGPGPMVFEASARTLSRKPGKKLATAPPTAKAKVPDRSVKRAVPKPSVKLPRPRA